MPANRRIRLARPCTGEDELDEVRAVLASGQLSQGPKVVEFEQQVAAYVGRRYAFATSSCTTALHLSLVALGVGPGDEVLVPDFTFPATANVVVQQGATPVLVDIDLDTYNAGAGELARHITARTRAVIPVHLFGLPADIGPITDFAAEHGLAVVEDAACALGAVSGEGQCGSFGDIGCYSFHARKVVTTGEGGMIVTDSDDLAARIAVLRSHGGVRTEGRFCFEAAGFNYRLSDIAAAVGCAQMRRLPELLRRRQELAERLHAGLAELDGIRGPAHRPGPGHAYQAFVALVDEGIDRDAMVTALAEAGIETTLGTYALHDQPFFQQTYGYRTGQLPASHAAYQRTIALPLYPEMTDDDADTVIEALKKALPTSARPG